MNLHTIHTVPVWHEADGSFTYGMAERNPHPPVIGWANVLCMTIRGEEYQLVAINHEEPA